MAVLDSIGREISVKYPSNRLALNIAAVAGLAGAVFGWWGERSWRVAAITALVWAGTSFAAWALTRELHHDNPRPASAAAILSPIGAAFFGAPKFLLVGAILFAARLALGSTGRRPVPVDLGIIVALGLWIARTSAGWAVSLVLAVVLLRVNARKPIKGGRWWGFGLAVGATIVLFATSGFTMSPLESGAPIALLMGALLGFGIAGKTEPTVECDSGAPPPSAADQFVARLMTFVALVAATLISANAGIVLPAAAGLVALSLRER